MIELKLSQGAKPANFVRGALFKAEFKAAQAAVQKAVEKLETALAVDTNITVHGIDGKVDAGNEKLDRVIALLEAKEGHDEGPLLQVVFTFLQFSEAEMSRVVAARANAAQGGRLSRRLSGWFS